MSDSTRQDGPTFEAPDPRPWQFGLARLIGLMTLVAAVAAIVRLGEMPAWARIGLGVYVVVLTGICFFQVTHLLPHLLGNSRHMQAIRRHRRDLAQWAQWRREEAAAADDNEKPEADEAGTAEHSG